MIVIIPVIAICLFVMAAAHSVERFIFAIGIYLIILVMCSLTGKCAVLLDNLE